MPVESIHIYINGERHELPAAQTVAALLTRLRIPAERVAIEMNKSIVRRREWDSVLVSEGALLEIVEFVGGG
jgi:thiamine biosynthesis protein ThiS